MFAGGPKIIVTPGALISLRGHWLRVDTTQISTGLCSCRVRGVDGSCAKHLTVESYMVIYARNSYTYYYYYYY